MHAEQYTLWTTNTSSVVQNVNWAKFQLAINQTLYAHANKLQTNNNKSLKLLFAESATTAREREREIDESAVCQRQGVCVCVCVEVGTYEMVFFSTFFASGRARFSNFNNMLVLALILE